MDEATLFGAYGKTATPRTDTLQSTLETVETLAQQLRALDLPVLARVASYIRLELLALARQEVAHTP